MRSKTLYMLSIVVVFTGVAICFAGHMVPGFLVGLIGAVGAYVCSDRPHDDTPGSSNLK
jgi:hypothetical protein